MEQLNKKSNRCCSYIPQEIITEILIRSPAKSLLRFKCVSKLWFSEISSPDFAKNHVKFSNKNKIASNYGLVSAVTNLSYRCCVEQVEGSGELINVIPLECKFINWGCCNGWICFSKERDRKPVLWNPSTRKVKGTRYSPAYIEMSNEYRGFRMSGPTTIYGFGYNEFTDDYKVVEIVAPRKKSIVSIYSLRNNYCKRLLDCPKALDDYSFLLNGALHWKADHKHLGISNDSDTSSIFWINLQSRDDKTTTYGELDFPQHTSTKNMLTRIGVLRDCLCASFNYFYDRVDIWIMKEYGVNKSWYKFVSVPHMMNNVKRFTRHVYIQRQTTPPIWLFENGEILLVHEGEMVCYNPTNNTFKSCFPRSDQLGKSYNHNLYERPECYVESLITLD